MEGVARGVAGKRLSSLTMLCLASAELGLVSLKWSLWISRPILLKRDPYGMGNVTIGPQVGGPLCSERVTETGQSTPLEKSHPKSVVPLLLRM